ncbi:MAG: SPOR domain-containing protein [Bryobacteraceae bacterium]|nr:SPOR domain-containing protein [Bryobacteraceae bacterium]
MPKNEEGEFELVLGNRQLLSVFFIVVVLLGVFFAMGFITGRNTAPGLREVATSQPIIVEAPGASSQPAEPPSKPREEPKTTASAPPPKEQPPAAAPPSKPAPEQEAKAQPAKPPETKPASVQPPKRAQETATAAAQTSDPPPGTYLQVAATTKSDANVLLQVLSKRGFAAKMAEVPGQDLYRVVVGPVEGAQALAKTRDDLRAAGFKPFTRRY